MRRLSTARRLGPSAICLTALTLTTGCTHIAQRHQNARRALDEQSRALTTGVVDALQLQPSEQRDSYTRVALQLAREDQRIEGLPLDSLPVPALAAEATNSPARLRAEDALARRFTGIEKLLATEQSTGQQLLALGERFEEERNVTRTRRARWITAGTLILGGAVALLVFVPAAAPILGRILAWCVAKIPSLASALGVVSVKAFDAVVKGIERTRQPAENSTGLMNANSSAQPENSALLLNLSRAMDADHKALVRARKATLN